MEPQQKGLYIVFEGTTCGGKDTQAELLVSFLQKEKGRTVLFTNEPRERYGSGKFIRWYIDRKSPHPGEYVFEEIQKGVIDELQDLLRHLNTFIGCSKDHKKALGEETIIEFIHIIGSVLKKIFYGSDLSLTTEELQAVYVANRYSHVKLFVLPELQKGSIVVSSRGFLSTFAHIKAFSGAGKFLEMAYRWHIHVLGELFLFPDLYIFLDTDPEVSFERLVKSGKTQDQYETGVEKIRKTYEAYKEAILFLHEEWKKIGESAHITTMNANIPIDEIHYAVRGLLVEHFPNL